MVSLSNLVAAGSWPHRMIRELLSQSSGLLPVEEVPYICRVAAVMQAEL